MSCTAVTKVKPFHRASLEPTSATCRRQKNISPCLFVLNSTLQKHSPMYTGPILLLVLSYIMYMHHACNIIELVIFAFYHAFQNRGHTGML